MDVWSGVAADLPDTMFSRIATYRHKVFIERLGWRLKTEGGFELDQFDRADTVYVVAQADDSRICGCARLLPTIHPYLLSEVFPQLCGDIPPPRSPDVWELSRFAAVDFAAEFLTSSRQYCSSVAVAILEAALASAAARGARWLVSVSPAGIERLLRRSGFSAHRAGPPKLVDGYPVIACWIKTEAVTRQFHH